MREEVPMKFKVALHPSEEGFAVSVPSLPGCWSQGATEEEALANIADAIRDYLEAEETPPDGAAIREIEVAL
jgi:predicted RNase H-like HicB family nuclease